MAAVQIGLIAGKVTMSGLRSRRRRGAAGAALLLSVPVAAVAFLIFGPLAMTAVVSFWSKSGFSMKPDFTFASYQSFLSGVRFSVFLRSLIVATLSTVLMLLIAYPIAYLIARKVRPDMVRSILLLFSVPFLVNYILRTFAWADVLGRTGYINGFLIWTGIVNEPLDWLLYSQFSVYLGLITAYMPFMIFPIWLSLSGIDKRYEEASWMLGSGRTQTFLRVTLPLSLPGIFAAGIFGFVGAFGEFAVSTILGGTGYQLFGNSIVSALDVINYPLAAAMTAFSVALMSLLLGLWFYFFDIRILLGNAMGRS